jgi:hypothetical protein
MAARRDLIAGHGEPPNQSPIILWPYPIDPWLGEPLPDEYDLLIYAKNGNRPQLLEHLAEVFPRHVQIHHGRYRREQLFQATSRSQACAYLADDDHGPLALQEIVLAGCPTVGVRTGASLVCNGITGVLVERLPLSRECMANEADEAVLATCLQAIPKAQRMNRQTVRDAAVADFGTDRVLEVFLTGLNHAQTRYPNLPISTLLRSCSYRSAGCGSFRLRHARVFRMRLRAGPLGSQA